MKFGVLGTIKNGVRKAILELFDPLVSKACKSEMACRGAKREIWDSRRFNGTYVGL